MKIHPFKYDEYIFPIKSSDGTYWSDALNQSLRMHPGSEPVSFHRDSDYIRIIMKKPKTANDIISEIQLATES